MTKEEAGKIFDSKGEACFEKLLDYALIEQDRDKAIKYFAEVTGCDWETAEELVLECCPELEKEVVATTAMKCPYCQSILISPNAKVDLLGDMILGKNMFLRERKQWHCHNCGSDF